jgi:hypothetical protein
MSSSEQAIPQIRRLARQAERRLRLDRLLRAGAKALSVALAVATAVVALRKVGLIAEGTTRAGLFACGLAVGVVLVAAWLRRLPGRAGARALDRFHGLHDRLASALSFAELPAAERTAFMDAAIADAGVVAGSVRPRAAVRIGFPKSLGWTACLAALFVGVMLFEVRRHVPIARAKTIDPIEMSSDDLDDVRDFLRQAQANSPNDDTKAAVEAFNKLVDDIANQRLDRTEAFRRMEALEEKLLTGSEADKKALEEQTARIGDELKKAELTRPAGEALAQDKLEPASDALRDLAKRLRSEDKPVDKAKLDQMREALKKAAADAAQRQAALEQRRQELADEILKMKEKAGDGGGSDEERSLLAKKERELERLDRDRDAHKDAGQRLDRLDRELAQAAEDLMKDLGASAQDLDQGAEDLNHMMEQDMTQQEKEELRQKLQELRELVRQQGQDGKGRIARLGRFSRMARGQGGSQGQGGQQQGGQNDGSGDPSGQGDSQGSNGQGGQPGQGGGGQGGSPSGSNEEVWVLDANGQKSLLVPSGGGQGEGQGSGSGSRASGAGGDGNQGGHGREWGEGHDPKVQGDATHPKMGTEDTHVQGNDTGQGGSRSQVILGAAERGFTSRGYKRVYTEYHQVAEESLSKDEIPGGYRFYVKRYFQLIRPRDGQ